MSTLFISDLHLDANEPGITELFFAFLQNQAKTAEALYILGDLFEVWIGDDNLNDYNQSIIIALKTLSSQMPLFILPGNRDFLLGQAFAKQTGATLLPDPCLIDLYGEPTLLMHGDSLCTQDKGHQRFRRIVRDPKLNQWFLKLPLSWRQKIADKMRQASQARTKRIDHEIMDVDFPMLPKIMEQNKVQQMIYGHTHRPSIYFIDPADKAMACYVLSDWGKQGNALVCKPNGEKRLIYTTKP